MPVAKLDYPGAEILMQADTEIEQAYRVRAVKKEPWTAAWIDAIPADDESVFYDIGSNVGSYALIAAKRGIATVAIEPATPNYVTLCRNIWLNHLDEVATPFMIALGDRRGMAWIDYQDLRSGHANHVLGSNKRLFYHRQLLLVWPLDEFIEAFSLRPPTHIKVDVDGAEMPVLAGMDKTLRSDTLRGLMVEMPLAREEAITTYLAERNWELSERFGERDGKPIANICYGAFVKVAPVAADTAVADAPPPVTALAVA